MEMRWLPLDEMLAGLTIPEGIRFEQLARDQIDDVIDRLRAWYPDIVVGAESRHLDRAFYERDSALRGEELGEQRDAPVYGLVCRGTSDDAIVGFMSLEKNARGRQISSPMGAVEPTQRGLGIGQFGAVILEHVGRVIGAEVAFYQVTLKTTRQQRNAERHGFKLCGILPAIDRDAIAPGVVRRVYEGIYVKVLAPAGEVHVPSWKDLGEPARALWLSVFGEHPERTS
jgi:hypothetical protein